LLQNPARRNPDARHVALPTCVGLALASLLVVDPAPSYDPWTWLLWGREVASGTLSTVDGPAFKPLPVAVCALLAPLGAAAPWAWVLLVRAAAAVAVWFAFRLGRELAGGSVAAGVLAGGGVALCGGLLAYSAAGAEPALLLALALGGAAAWRERRYRIALACAVGCALLRVEAWPFLLAAGVLLWRRRPQDRLLLVALALLVPAAWFLPEWIGSGDLLRSGTRARVPNPGQPALADVPGLAALEAAARLPLWPLWLGVAALAVAAAARAGAARRALAPAAAGAAWLLIVALMAQAGFSGEPRYALPGAALIAISGAVGLAGLAPRRAAIVALAVVVVAAAAYPRVAGLADVRAAQAYQWRLASDLADAVRAAGGRDAVLACGRPYVGPLRGPLMAYRLGVAKRVVEPDAPPRAPGVIFRSALSRSAAPAPAAPPRFAPTARAGAWQVLADCVPPAVRNTAG
jgi:hypothetical protein